MPSNELLTSRLARLAAARLYLVCDSRPGGRELEPVLRAAIAGGVDIVQLRDKQLDDAALVAIAREAAELCVQLGALLIVNDRPAVARAAGADGVHVGQNDIPLAQVRALVGEELLVGLSTHSPAQIEAAGPGGAAQTDTAGGPDYIGVGPVHATPTKPGRPAVGLELVHHAATHARLPWFAIGGIDADNIDKMLDAGATRVAVVRAIAHAQDPAAAARELRGAIDEQASVVLA